MMRFRVRDMMRRGLLALGMSVGLMGVGGATEVPPNFNPFSMPVPAARGGDAPAARPANASAPAAAPAPAAGGTPAAQPASAGPFAAPAVQPAPAGPFAAPAPAAPASAAVSEAGRGGISAAPVSGISLKFDNADIYEVIQAVLGDILGVDYVIDPALQGKVTLKSLGAVSQADIYNVLEAALSLNQISIVREGRVYRVMRDANAVREHLAADAQGPHSPVIQVIPVRFVQASQLVNTLRNFIGPQAAMTNDPTNHYLIVADRASNVAKIVDMVKVLDVDYFKQVRIKLVPLQRADAVDLAKDMEALFKTSGLFNWTGTDAAKAFFQPVARMNAILVAASNDAVLEAAEKWIGSLDAAPVNALSDSVHVYPLANNNAEHVANILRQIFGGAPSTSQAGGQGQAIGSSSLATQSPQGAPAGAAQANVAKTAEPSRTIVKGSVPGAAGGALSGAGLAGSVVVIADEATNTLVIRAGTQDYQQIKKVIERIDTVPRQVLVQVMVAEISLNDTLQYGVEWYLRSKLSVDGKSWLAKAALDSGLTAPSGNMISGAVGAAASGLNYSVLNGAGDVVGLLNLLGQTTDVNVLSSPHVLASDGKTARIEVGNDEPVVTGTVSSPTSVTGGLTTSNSVQYRPTGILLEVRPVINDSGMVTLTISQEVSVRGAKNVQVGGSEYPSFSKRKVTTDVSLEEGTTLIIGGLIQDKGNNGTLGLPLLKDIPLVGGLFGTTTKGREKTELMITVTPYVVRNKAEGNRITQAFNESLRDLKGLIANSPSPRLDRQGSPRPAAVN